MTNNMAKHSTGRRCKRGIKLPTGKKLSQRMKECYVKKNTPESHVNYKKYLGSKNASRHQMFISLVVVVLAIIFAFMNSFHQSTMFENDRHFSHLSALEREMTFRTEMGLYYYYFKVITEASSLWNGIHQIMNDNRTEYPSTINTLERFNLYPEILLGAAYKGFIKMTEYLQLETKECWKVLRGDGLPPIESCEGLGEASYFYVMSVFLLNGLVGALLFLYGTFLSDSLFGGILSAASFFFNHGECTRVQWTPPLRESFGYPVFLLQMLIVTLMLRNQKPKREEPCILGVLTCLFILFWQFAQFALLTQVLAVFCTYSFSLISTSTFRSFLKGHILGLALALVHLFGNKMLLTSFYASSLLVAVVITFIEKELKNFNSKLLRMSAQVIILFAGSVALKALFSLILGVADDVHIWNILRSKISSYQDFHTMLYTCANEFDYLEYETFVRLTKTLLLPVGVIVLLAVPVQVILKRRKVLEQVMYEEAYIMYNLLQLLAFFVMAVLIMRLKLFFTPHLCLVISLILSKKFFNYFNKKKYYAVIALLLSLMAFQGVQNIQEQRNIIGEFSNPHLEELISWINISTDQNAVFGGPMPTMANILLSTRRPIVNHPHYENAALRNRTYQVYKIFSRKPAREVYNVLESMGVEYVVIEKKWCFGRSRAGCSMADLWDVEDKINHGKEPLCQRLTKDAFPFRKVFQNAAYTVLRMY